MAKELTPGDVDEQPHNPPALTSDDVDSLPPGLMKKPAPAEPTPAHRDRLSKALRDLDQFRARRGEHGAQFTSPTGKIHRVGDRVSVNGHTGVIARKHPSSGLPEITWDSESTKSSRWSTEPFKTPSGKTLTPGQTVQHSSGKIGRVVGQHPVSKKAEVLWSKQKVAK